MRDGGSHCEKRADFIDYWEEQRKERLIGWLGGGKEEITSLGRVNGWMVIIYTSKYIKKGW